jgi:hypothetical protein
MMQILQAHDRHGWITAIIEGRWVQAKVYDEPSVFGVNEGRVSKLSIGKTDTYQRYSDFFLIRWTTTTIVVSTSNAGLFRLQLCARSSLSWKLCR